MKIAVDKMYRLPDAGSLLAFADISLDDVIIIRGVRLLRGKKGIFMSMPQEQGKDNKWYDQVMIRDAATFDQITQTVIAFYERDGRGATTIDQEGC